MPLRDAVPGLQAAAAAGRGGVLGHEDRVVAVRGLPAVVARLGRRQPLRNDLRGVSPHRLRTAQLSRGPLAPAQVEPPPERSRTRAVDPVIDLGGVGHAPRLGTARWPTTKPRPAGSWRGCEPWGLKRRGWAVIRISRLGASLVAGGPQRAASVRRYGKRCASCPP